MIYNECSSHNLRLPLTHSVVYFTSKTMFCIPREEWAKENPSWNITFFNSEGVSIIHRPSVGPFRTSVCWPICSPFRPLVANPLIIGLYLSNGDLYRILWNRKWLDMFLKYFHNSSLKWRFLRKILLNRKWVFKFLTHHMWLFFFLKCRQIILIFFVIFWFQIPQ